MIRKGIIAMTFTAFVFICLGAVSGFSKPNSLEEKEEPIKSVMLSMESIPSQQPIVEDTPLEIDTSNLIFVGNSLIEGLNIVSNDSNRFLTKVGIDLVELKSDIYSGLYEYACGVVVIGMGTNELGLYNEELFKSEFKDLIEHIRGINEDSVIICLSIPPVSSIKSSQDSLFNNDNVILYNGYLKEISETNDLIYIDNSVFFGEFLQSDWTEDGIHLNMGVYKEWYSFILEQISNL